MRHWCLIHWLIVCGALCTARLQAASVDRLMDLPAMAVPVINLSPETNWVFGAAVQAYPTFRNARRTSILQLDGAYSLNKQWYINASGVLYFGGTHPWLLAFNGGYRDYPDTYYPRGNGYSDGYSGQPYLSKRGRARIEALWDVGNQWSIGPKFDFITERTDITLAPDMLQWGVGLVAQYDSRDIVFFPTRGLFFKTEALYYEPTLGSTCRLGTWKADLRQFIPIQLTDTRTMVIAWQFRTEWTFAQDNNSIPFQMLPTLGGQDLVRGVRAGMYRDNALLALQAELRLPIWSILHATIFAGVGDVYNPSKWQATPKIGYGLGLRATINKAKINIRADVARNNIQTSWRDINSYSFYLTATEAF